MTASAYGFVVSLKKMITDTNTALGTSYTVYDLNDDVANGPQYPCIIIDSDSEIEYGYWTVSGSMVCAFYFMADATKANQQNEILCQNLAYNFVNGLRALPRNVSGYLQDYKIRLVPGVVLDTNAKGVANGYKKLYARFDVEFGASE